MPHPVEEEEEEEEGEEEEEEEEEEGEEEGEGEEEEEEEQTESTGSIEVDVTAHTSESLNHQHSASNRDSDTESTAHAQGSIQRSEMSQTSTRSLTYRPEEDPRHMSSPSNPDGTSTHKPSFRVREAARGGGERTRASTGAKSKASKRLPGFQDASVQTTQPDIERLGKHLNCTTLLSMNIIMFLIVRLPTVAPHLGTSDPTPIVPHMARDPTPIVPHVVSADVLEGEPTGGRNQCSLRPCY